ncbi:MAG: nitroreductase family protein [Atopobiaceae bacterium]|jgi:nitroreductase|nr:nitroreductase family protein [Atopobiaceae bacterium]MCH4179771.1 nitroreductase family protein [Atopobiaceae bacterium]MCH4213523.1 nitroreductase family protein [Atopobiaceae bacterium]MCH4229667.1 nitroreductase family protein [Atopobiaceae bacterium]MCH4276170.1 nitroreductase family protein [Atopobiaceae bacterium]
MTQDDFAQLVRSSRSCRRFDEENPVTSEDLLALVDVARFAPSANNLQLLRFYVTAEAEEVARIEASHHWAGLIADWDGPAAGERPTGYIVICMPAGMEDKPLHNLDAGIAAQTIMLAATAAGIGGCMIKSYSASLGADLGLLEKGFAPVLLLALGRPAETPVLEPVDADHGQAYWLDEAGVNHVPKLELDDLLV